MGINEPGADVIQRAVGRAIEQYWKDKQGDPERFLRFILEQDWHETSDASHGLKRCPVPLSQPVQGEAWAEAGKAYFGREWGNDLLADLYAGIEAVAWVSKQWRRRRTMKRRRRVLEWLGVAACPRIVEEANGAMSGSCQKIVADGSSTSNTARDYCGRRSSGSCVSRMDHLALDRVDARQGSLLIRLIAKHWDGVLSQSRRGHR